MFRWFENRLNPFPAEEPVEPPKTLLAFCIHYTRGVWPYIAIDAVLIAAIAVAEVWMFGFLGHIVDWLSAQNRETFLQTEKWKLAGMAFVVLFVLPGTVWFHSLLNQQTVMGNYPMRIRWQVHRYLLKQSMTFYQDEFAGRIATKLMQTALAVRECVIKLIDVLNYVIVYFLGMLVIVGSADWRLAVPLAVWLIGYLVLLKYFIPRLGKVGEEQADARSTMTGRVVDSYTNIQTVKLFSHAKREASFAKEGMASFLDTVYRSMRLVTKLYGVLYVLNSLLLFSVAALSIWLWLGEMVTIGAVAVVIGLVLRLWGMSQWIMWEVTSLFENIGGRSGAGKSTLVNLLLRFYDLEGGRILIDGDNIAEVTQDSLRAHIGMVTQDTSLLHRSVSDNILYGRPDAGEEAMVEAARRAEALGFVGALADAKGRKGFDAHVGERGVKLSGGQRQRIAIARVMLKDAPILILDEATSALDSEVEAAIQENLYKLMQGKTVIAIAHRLSTIAAMDRLVVMDQGRVIEEGTHDELVAKGGLYAQLWQRQSGGFLLHDDPGHEPAARMGVDVTEEAAE